MNENIWGEEECMGPDGLPCHLCCIGLRIEATRPNGAKFIKPELEPCSELLPEPSNEGWCGVYDQRPLPCKVYHCSDSSSQIKRHLINIANIHGYASSDHIEDALDRVEAQEYAAKFLDEF